MEGFRKLEPSQKLITKGCCFLCLTNEEINQTLDYEGNQVVKSTSVRSLLRHLQITAKYLNEEPLSGHDFKKEDIQVDLCENCGEMISRLSVLFQEMEKIQLEMNYFLERIHKCIKQSAKVPELVQNYSKRMTSDLAALSQLAFVDNLRKEVSNKCLKELNVTRLQVVLNREHCKLIKTENIDTACGSSDWDFPGSVESAEDSFPHLASPPPSPNSTEDHEEEIKFSKVSVSAFTENEKNSPLPKPQVKLIYKGKYYTKDPSTRLYECNKCGKQSKSPKTIVDHFKTVHLKLRYKCDICNVSVFTRLGNLKAHKKTCQENLAKELRKEKDPKFKFICKICGKRFETSRKRIYHRRVHTYANRFHCDRCDKKYSSPAALKNHQAVVHQSRKLFCKICNKVYKDVWSIKKHEKKCVEKCKIKVESVNCE